MKAVDIATSTFERASFDLIYARPGQSPQEWQAELEEALRRAGLQPLKPFAADDNALTSSNAYAVGQAVLLLARELPALDHQLAALAH